MFIIVPLALALPAYVLMMLFGALSHLLETPQLAIGFWPTFVGLWILRIVFPTRLGK